MKKSRHDEAAVARAGTLFFMVRGLVRAKLARGRRLDPYKWLRIETLVYIRDHEGALMKDIAAHLSITAPSATSVINTLARERLVERRTDLRDKRSLRLRLTKRGRSVLEETIKHGMRALGEVFAPLSPSDLATFTRLLERIEAGSRG